MEDFLYAKSLLNSAEDCFELKIPAYNNDIAIDFCKTMQNNFFTYHKGDNKNRFALPIVNVTGKIDDSSFIIVKDDLHEMLFTTPTPYYYQSGLDKILDNFREDVGRTHIINVKQGGYFSPHRDGPNFLFPTEETFRLLVCIQHCGQNKMHFVLNNKILSLHDAKIFYINTIQVHSLVSFNNDCFFLLANIRITKKSVFMLHKLTALNV